MPSTVTNFGVIPTAENSIDLDALHPELLRRLANIVNDPELQGDVVVVEGPITHQQQAFLFENNLSSEPPDLRRYDGGRGSILMVQSSKFVYADRIESGEYGYAIRLESSQPELLRVVAEKNGLVSPVAPGAFELGLFVMNKNQTDKVNRRKEVLLKHGDSGEEVTQLQNDLNTLRAVKPKLKVDGIFGNDTEEAVRVAQAAFGITIDGKVSRQTKRKIRKAIAKEETIRSQEQAKVTVPALERNLFHDSAQPLRGEDVKALQRRLSDIGYPINVDGIYGGKTDVAVRDFQSISGLLSDGVVGHKTWAALWTSTQKKTKAIPRYLEGIDVSKWQSTVDWKDIGRDSSADIKFAFVKATEIYWSNSQNKKVKYKDPQFIANVEGARSIGIDVGAYHYAHPQLSSAKDEAQFFLKTMTGRETLPAVLDLEEDKEASHLGKQATTRWALDFMEIIQSETGVRPILYTGYYWAESYLQINRELADYPLWLPWYGRTTAPPAPAPWDNWAIWQYTSSGSVGGLSPLDRNKLSPEAARLWGIN